MNKILIYDSHYSSKSILHPNAYVMNKSIQWSKIRLYSFPEKSVLWQASIQHSNDFVSTSIKCHDIGVGRFRIFGRGGGANSQQAHDVVTTSMRRNDVASTLFRRHVPTRFLINQCQIITFLILKSDVENLRIELKGIVLPVPSNQIKVSFIIILPFNLVHLWFFLFHIEIEGKGGWIIGGGGAKGYVGPPL